jgi:hypothetical protein
MTKEATEMQAMAQHKAFGEPYVRTYHGEGTRILMVHMWPMIFFSWVLFMLGMLAGKVVGAKTVAAAMQGEGGMQEVHHPMMGMRGRMMGKKAMMSHHHHGHGGPCMCAEDNGRQTSSGEHEQQSASGGQNIEVAEDEQSGPIAAD